MALAQSTIVVYPLDGSNRRFMVPFEYLARKFVVVTLLGTERTPLTLGLDYRFVSLIEIETTKAWGDADGYPNIEIRRVTSATDRLVDFSDGSILRARDMNVSAVQTIHIAEEARNLASDTLATDDAGNLDARGRKLINLASGTNGGDAVNVLQMELWSGSALSQANRSEQQANISKAAADRAKLSETNSKNSETASKLSETNSKNSETASKLSETNSKNSETNSKNSETTASTAADNSTYWANTAYKLSSSPEDIAVPEYAPTVVYSAYHWAQKAYKYANGDFYLHRTNNLSDLDNKAQARVNIGLSNTALYMILYPVGVCYTQYPDTPEPSALFGGVWKKLFAEEGVFFRTEGTNTLSTYGDAEALPFEDNEIQGDTVGSRGYDVWAEQSIAYASGTVTMGTFAPKRGVHPNARGSSYTHPLAPANLAETRPINRTIRVWQRVS